MSERPDGRCVVCERNPAVICDACRRSLALADTRQGFATVARHPEQGTDCRVCAAGPAACCVECCCWMAAGYRRHLLASHATRQATVEELRSAAWGPWTSWWRWGGLKPRRRAE